MEKEPIILNIEEMAAAGLGTGHRVSKLHPKMKQYVSGIKNGVHTIDLTKTAEKFGQALEYIRTIISEGKNLLIIGTKVPSKALVKSNSGESVLPYVNTRWLGGTFTNFDTILKRVNHFKQLMRDKETGALEKYTKKERLKLDKEIELLRNKFEGIKDMVKLPEAILVLDMKKDGTAAKEAKKKGIKIIAVCDTNIDPSFIDYVIPANDDSISSIKYILEKVKQTVVDAKSKMETLKEKQ